MGAFGEMLIRNWGGDLDAYRGNNNSRNNIVDVKELTDEEKKAEHLKFIRERQISYAKDHLRLLTNNIMYKPEICDVINEKMFKEAYRTHKFSDEISDLMWIEYNNFVDKYIKKI